MLKNRWLKLLLLIALCLLLGLIDAARSYTSAYYNEVFYLDWETAVRWDVTVWLVWVFFIPLILYLSKHFPITQDNWFRNIPLFLMLGVSVAVIKTIAPIFVYSSFDKNFDQIL